MAIYLENLQVDAFRGIQQLLVKNLNHVNIIAGDNNSGKTSILEALLLFRNPREFSNILRVARLREISSFYGNSLSYENFMNLFPQGSDPLTVSIVASGQGNRYSVQIVGVKKTIMINPEEYAKRSGGTIRTSFEQVTMFDSSENETECFQGNLNCKINNEEFNAEIEYHPYSQIMGREISKRQYLNITYLSPVEHIKRNIFNEIIKNDSYKEICLHVLKIFDEQIKDIFILKDEITGRPVDYIKHETLGNTPLLTYGDGIKKVLALANGIAQAAGGILLIDEVETAIHSKYYADIFHFIVKACRQFDVQLFITTHSIEAIDGLLATQDYEMQNNHDDISVLTFKKNQDNGKTYSRILLGRHVYSNRQQFGFEVRL